ncbi:RING-H2 finger protein ATL5 [Carex littledalei]|uniref:RING-type E3 ubiquitin transferase n=1 Tax=Carex littledalei TaxID=544730 RepID=A0A833QHA0_9POAL|nr:RING-H2 finger protein ATL5 [Carex littledalei]
MSNPNNTNPYNETTKYASELHGRGLSLIVAASVILFLLIFFFILLWQHKKQQRGMNSTNRDISVMDVECQMASQAAMEIPSLPVFAPLPTDTTELRDCSVCLSEIGDSSNGRLLPACGHAFHKECIDLWFRYRSTCPVCRADILREPCVDQKVQPKDV